MFDYGMTLEAVERNYGSVAEYNRVMAEEYEYDEFGNLVPRKYEEPTEEELAEEAKKHRIYERKLKVLSGTPSDFAVRLKKEIDELSPKKEDYPSNSNKYYYACREYSRAAGQKIIEEVNAHYSIELSKDVSPYRLPAGKFAISIEHEEYGRIYHYSVRTDSYETFKDIFRDLEYLDERPTMFFGREKSDTLILSNSSLGNLRYCDFVNYGLETYEEMDAEVIAFNKAEYEANKGNSRLYNRVCTENYFHPCQFHHYIGQIEKDDDKEYVYCDINSNCSKIGNLELPFD